MKQRKKFFWPVIGLVAVIWSLKLLYAKLLAEVAVDPSVKAALLV